MFVINRSKIKSGDILLIRHNDGTSERIRQMSGSEYSHAIFCVSDSSCIESEGDGVQAQNIQRLSFDHEDDVALLRWDGIEDDVLNRAVIFARQKIGTEYSTFEARQALRKPNEPATEMNRQFCTRFVAQALQQAGVKIVDNPDYCSPQDILTSPLLKRVRGFLRKGTGRELAYAAETVTPLTEQREIHNNMLEKVRNLTGSDVQTIEQMSQYLIDNPKFDQEIVAIVSASGYLNMWQKDIDRNPGYYDLKKLKIDYPDKKHQQAIIKELKRTEPATRAHLEVTLMTMVVAYQRTKLEYFKVFKDLYMKLIELSYTRENLGQQVVS